jgi:hypothetical protein
LLAFKTTILFVVSIRIIKSIFETWVHLGVLYSTMFSWLFLSLNPTMHAISIFAFVSRRIIKSVFETWVYLGLLYSTMFSLFFYH